MDTRDAETYDLRPASRQPFAVPLKEAVHD
jgi:hypothetical protein